MSLPDYFTKAAITEAEGRAKRSALQSVNVLLERIADLEARVTKLEKP